MTKYERKRLIREAQYELSILLRHHNYIIREHRLIDNAKERLREVVEKIKRIKRNLIFLTLTSSEPTPKNS